ncbi:hypothetical protein OVA24_16750 [Luteolibacter sp. SL250]|uniref:hypothetical protein n=1 Tax=Luteolibacter sp. SL250 TaxID=2995170 RepID=UPI00226DD864|nr:hypothetical protein [Luteolibacter sp. SL250]WAC18882.1 hypothetical protein OVA24_16750 [Luteolibacter sp. SL250]
MSKEVHLSEHGEARGKERVGLNAKALRRTAAKARAEGLRPTDTNGRLRRYLDKISIEHPGRHPRIHGEHIFIFAASTLITVLNLPHEFRNAAAKARRKKFPSTDE